MEIPRDRLTVRTSRSSGPGGQKVNKTETKVEVRFRLAGADWIPEAVRRRLRALYPGHVTRGGDFVVVSSRHRTRARNLEDALAKLEAMLERAARPPKRRVPTKPTRAARERRQREKARRSAIKRARQWRPDSREE